MRIEFDRVSETGLAAISHFVTGKENILDPKQTEIEIQRILEKELKEIERSGGSQRSSVAFLLFESNVLNRRHVVSKQSVYGPVATIVSATRATDKDDCRLETKGSYTVEIDLPLYVDIRMTWGSEFRTVGHILVNRQYLEVLHSLAVL